jgi:hypothetical protein
MPLTADEADLVTLMQSALTDAYPGREQLTVSAQLHTLGWLNILVTETGASRSRVVRMPVKRDRIASDRVRDLRDSLLEDLVMQLGRPGPVASR